MSKHEGHSSWTIPRCLNATWYIIIGIHEGIAKIQEPCVREPYSLRKDDYTKLEEVMIQQHGLMMGRGDDPTWLDDGKR